MFVKKYKPGMLVFFDWNSIISKAIKYFDNSKWSHIGIIIDVDEDSGSLTLFESLISGPEFRTYGIGELQTYEERGQAYAYMIDYPKSTKLKKLKEYAEKYNNRDYGFISYPFIIMFLIMKNLGMKTKVWSILFSGSKSKKGYFYISLKGLICSELIVRLLYDVSNRKINFEEATGKPWDITSPGDIWAFRNHNWK